MDSSDQTDKKDLAIKALTEQMEQLKNENRRLLLQHEITMLEHEIDRNASKLAASTPYQLGHSSQTAVKTELVTPVISQQPPVTRRRRLLPRTPTYRGFTVDQGCQTGCSEDLVPDNFVTQRKRAPKSNQSSETKQPIVKAKPATYDGSTSWPDYLAHFEAVSTLNDWSEKSKGLYLSVSLRGQAQGVFGNLAKKTTDFNELVQALEARFSPPNQTELYRVQLRDRRQKATESMAELGQDIRRLTNLAYPSAPSDVRETLAKEQFVDSLANSEMRLKIKQSRPTSLNDAVRNAVELEAFYRAERQQHGLNQAGADEKQCSSSELQEIRSTMARMQQALDQLTSEKKQNPSQGGPNREYEGKKSGPSQNTMHTDKRQEGWDGKSPNRLPVQNAEKTLRKCYECGSEKHLRNKCPLLQRPQNSKGYKKQENCDLSRIACAGLYATAVLDERCVECLVDTGASLTLISCALWRAVQDKCVLSPFDTPIVSASGDHMKVHGRTEICLQFGDLKCPLAVVVADLEADVVLGIDFMRTHQVTVDITRSVMTVKGVDIELQQFGKVGCYREVLDDGIEVPSHSELITKERVSSPGAKYSYMGCGLIESNPRFLGQNIDQPDTESQDRSYDQEADENPEQMLEEDRLEKEAPSQFGRSRRRPVWAKDYVFSQEMKVAQERIGACGVPPSQRLKCCTCGKTFKRRVYVRKHHKTAHGKPKGNGAEKVYSQN